MGRPTMLVVDRCGSTGSADAVERMRGVGRGGRADVARINAGVESVARLSGGECDGARARFGDRRPRGVVACAKNSSIPEYRPVCGSHSTCAVCVKLDGFDTVTVACAFSFPSRRHASPPTRDGEPESGMSASDWSGCG
eukprot:IDg12021t1